MRSVLPLLLASTASAQDLAMGADVRWEPEQPRQGTLFYVIVSPNIDGSEVNVSGQMAGQELHFARDSAGQFRAIAPIPRKRASEYSLHVRGRSTRRHLAPCYPNSGAEPGISFLQLVG